MSKLTRIGKSGKLETAVSELKSIIADGGQRYLSSQTAISAIGMEDLNEGDLGVLHGNFETLMHDLRGSSIATDLLQGMSPANLEIALESCALTIMSSGDPSAYYQGVVGAVAAPVNGILVSGTQPGMVFSDQFGMESFDPISIAKYLPYTAIANALSVINGDFEAVWFPPQIVPAGQTGVDVEIRIPRIFSTVTRSNNGVPVAFTKHSIINALIDSSLLDSEATTVIPYASSATLPVSLVPNSVVTTAQRMIDGVAVDTRPILFGVEVDVIALSSAPGLLANGVFDSKDSLDPVMNIGTVFYKLSVTTGVNTQNPVLHEVILEADVSTHSGTQFTQMATGQPQGYQANPTVQLVVKNDFTAVMGNAPAFVTAVETVLGIAPGTNFALGVSLRLGGTANTETAVMVVDANAVSVTKLYDANNNEVSVAALNTASGTTAASGVGYVPLIRRTNSNLRTVGTIIDNNTIITYRFPVKLSAPIILQAPVGAINTTTLEGLAVAQRIRCNNNCVKALRTLEDILVADNGIPSQSAMMGAEFVTPTYSLATMDVAVVVNNMQSQYALTDLQGAFTAAITNMANDLLVRSGYLAALEFVTNSNEGFEIIIVTSPDISAHLMVVGENRTFGDRRRYKITTSLNEYFADKLYLSFRRSERSNGLHPLDFGGQLVTPALTYDVQVTRNGSTIKEIHTIPRTVPYAVLPILGRIDVSNMSSMYVSTIA